MCKTVSSLYKPYSQGNHSEVLFRLILASEISGGLEIPNPVKRILLTWTARVALHASSSSTDENIHVTREATSSARHLATMSKNNFRGITL